MDLYNERRITLLLFSVPYVWMTLVLPSTGVIFSWYYHNPNTSSLSGVDYLKTNAFLDIEQAALFTPTNIILPYSAY